MGIIKKNQIIILFPLFIISFFSCILINQNKFADLIIENKWTGETVFFSDVSSEISKQKYINRGWSKLNKDKNIPYFKLKKRIELSGNLVKSNHRSDGETYHRYFDFVRKLVGRIRGCSVRTASLRNARMQ